MSSYLKMGFGLGNNNPIVLDIGEAYTKLGFAGEPEPRAIIPTAIQQVGGPVTYIFKKDHSSIVGHYQGISLKKSIIKFLEKIFFKELQISSRNQRIILCESLLNPTKIRHLIAEILFHHFEVASLVFAPHHLLSCFTVATGTAMVVDCSYGETVVIPIIEGTPVLWAWQSAPLAGAAIHEEIMKSISDNGKVQINHNPLEPVSKRLSENVLEDIKVKACFVAEYERAKLIQEGKRKELEMKESDSSFCWSDISGPEPALTDMEYPLNGNMKLLIPGHVRESASEVLFQQDNDRISIPTLVLDAFLRCPLVSRRDLADSILVTGGTSMLPGFRHRLLFELKELAKSEGRYKRLSALEFRVHNPPVPANLVSWVGAAIFSSLEIFKKKLVTKEFFDQHNGALPDWCGPSFPDNIAEQTPRSAPVSKVSLKSKTKLKPR